MPWFSVAYSSFSRAACTEAAQRASVIAGIPEQKLQTDGYFRTIHSAALRCLGVDSKVIVDQETVSGKSFTRKSSESHEVVMLERSPPRSTRHSVSGTRRERGSQGLVRYFAATGGYL